VAREQRPPRLLGGPHTVFWDYCNRGELRLQRCDECGSYLWPPAPICDGCLADRLTWLEVSGNGRIVTWCTVERQYYPECPTPWPVILVELDEGPWFVSNPRGIALSEITEGMAVKATMIACEDVHGPFMLPVFEAPR
jgi:uncharacterized OB-fold protein